LRKTGKGVPETGSNSGEDQQTAGGEILPVEDRPLSHWPVPQVDQERAHSLVLVVPVPDPDPGAPLQELPPLEGPAEILREEVLQATGRRKNRSRIRDLFADERCSQAILDFLSTTDVGRRVGLDRAVEEAQSEASESELREREAREEDDKRLKAGEQGRVRGDCTLHSIFGRARGATRSHLRTGRGRGGHWPGLG
jgi:hypothetical protein